MKVSTVVVLSLAGMVAASVTVAQLVPAPDEEKRRGARIVSARAEPSLAPEPSSQPIAPVTSPPDHFLQVATLKAPKEAIRQAEIFRAAEFCSNVFLTDRGNYVVALGPFLDSTARQLERDRFLGAFPGYEALPRPGSLFDEKIWTAEPPLPQHFADVDAPAALLAAIRPLLEER